MQYTTNPKWFYKPIVVPNLKEIQTELLNVLHKEISDINNIRSQFIYVVREKIEPFAPLYVEFINSLGILDKWHYSAIITTNNNIEFPIHVDSLNWETRCYGLNVPVLNCENTYTVFYDAIIDSTEFTERDNKINAARLIKEGCVPIEIDRWEASKPAWINTSIPHAPVSLHNKPRAIISARFKPELHDLLYDFT